MSASISPNSDGSLDILVGSTVALHSDSAGNVTFPVGATQMIGVGQTLQDVTASRSAGVTYINSTGKPFLVSIIVYMATNPSTAYLTVGGVVASRVYLNASGQWYSTMTAIVSAGETYSVTQTNSTLTWLERR